MLPYGAGPPRQPETRHAKMSGRLVRPRDEEERVAAERRSWGMRLAINVLRPLCLMSTKRTWLGTEHVPRTGPVIVAANHNSWADPPIVGHFLVDGVGRAPYFLAKAELFRIPAIGKVLRSAGQIPVYRRSANAADALRDARAGLHDGRCIVIYPEGTTTRDPDLWAMSPKTGVARLALETGVPVVPLAHWGIHRILPPRGSKVPRPWPRKKVVFKAGPPVDLSAYAGLPPTPENLRAVADTIMVEVQRLLGEIRGEQPPARFHDARESRAGTAADVSGSDVRTDVAEPPAGPSGPDGGGAADGSAASGGGGD